MNWRKHILIGALSLNAVLYLSTAVWIVLIKSQQAQAELSRFTSLTGNILNSALIQKGHPQTRDLIKARNEKMRTEIEKINLPSSELLKIKAISKNQGGTLNSLMGDKSFTALPLILLTDHNYLFANLDKTNRLYITADIPLNETDTSSPESIVVTYEVNTDVWFHHLKKIHPDIRVSIVEQTHNTAPYTLFTQLQNVDLRQLLQQSPFRSPENYMNPDITFTSSLSSTKFITHPFVLSRSQHLQQVIYYSLASPEFEAISSSSVFILLVALWTALIAFILGGLHFGHHFAKESHVPS